MAGAVQTQTQTQGKIERHGPRDFRAEERLQAQTISLPWKEGAVKHLTDWSWEVNLGLLPARIR